METFSQQAMTRLSEFSAKTDLDVDEQAELVALMMVVSPGEVQRIERRWFLEAGKTLIHLLIAALILSRVVKLWLFICAFLVSIPAAHIGVSPMILVLLLHGLTLGTSGYRKRHVLRDLPQWMPHIRTLLRSRSLTVYRDRKLLALWRDRTDDTVQ